MSLTRNAFAKTKSSWSVTQRTRVSILVMPFSLTDHPKRAQRAGKRILAQTERLTHRRHLRTHHVLLRRPRRAMLARRLCVGRTGRPQDRPLACELSEPEDLVCVIFLPTIFQFRKIVGYRSQPRTQTAMYDELLATESYGSLPALGSTLRRDGPSLDRLARLVRGGRSRRPHLRSGSFLRQKLRHAQSIERRQPIQRARPQILGSPFHALIPFQVGVEQARRPAPGSFRAGHANSFQARRNELDQKHPASFRGRPVIDSVLSDTLKALTH